MQDVVLSQKTVDLEVRFRKELKFSLSFWPVTQPMGPSADMEKMTIAGNPVIPRKVDQLMQENLKAKTAVGELLNVITTIITCKSCFLREFLAKRIRRKKSCPRAGASRPWTKWFPTPTFRKSRTSRK